MSNNISTSHSFNQDVRKLTQESDKKESASLENADITNKKTTGDLQVPISVTNKKRLNASILEAALKYEGTISSQPQLLLLKAALEGINESLKALGVEKNLQQSVDEGLDVSPQATADRIVTFSTNFFPLYLKQHPEMQEQEALTKFTEVISGGIDQGFSEAKEVLLGLNVLKGDIASNIEKTYDLVQQGLADFIEKYNHSDTPLTE